MVKWTTGSATGNKKLNDHSNWTANVRKANNRERKTQKAQRKIIIIIIWECLKYGTNNSGAQWRTETSEWVSESESGKEGDQIIQGTFSNVECAPCHNLSMYCVCVCVFVFASMSVVKSNVDDMLRLQDGALVEQKQSKCNHTFYCICWCWHCCCSLVLSVCVRKGSILVYSFFLIGTWFSFFSIWLHLPCQRYTVCVREWGRVVCVIRSICRKILRTSTVSMLQTYACICACVYALENKW